MVLLVWNFIKPNPFLNVLAFENDSYVKTFNFINNNCYFSYFVKGGRRGVVGWRD